MKRRYALARRRIGVARTRVMHLARRAPSAAAMAAREEKHTLSALVTAAGFGYLASMKGTTLPYVKSIGMAGTYGLLLWAGGRFLKNKTLSHMATGLLSSQAFVFGSEAGVKARVSGELIGDEIEV